MISKRWCLLLGITIGILACDKHKAQVAMPPAQVSVATPLKKSIIEWDSYVGRFAAVEDVNIRSRVSGYLDSIRFKDGQLIKKGDILFVIDQRPFQYALTRAQAQYALAKKQYERVLKLEKQSFVSLEVIDQRFQEMRVSETRLKDAELNLAFTEIRSPIDGKISHYFVSVGNLIQVDNTLLTRVVSVDPIYFYLNISQDNLLKYLRLNKGITYDKTGDTPVLIKLQDEKQYVHTGKMNFIDNVVDRSTGTILARASVPNKEKLIYPGLFGQARLVATPRYQALLLPEKAINSDQSRKFVYLVGNDNKVGRAYIELGPLRASGFYVIRQGLTGQEKVVIDGIQRIHASGQEVKPVLKQLEEEGMSLDENS